MWLENRPDPPLAQSKRQHLMPLNFQSELRYAAYSTSSSANANLFSSVPMSRSQNLTYDSVHQWQIGSHSFTFPIRRAAAEIAKDAVRTATSGRRAQLHDLRLTKIRRELSSSPATSSAVETAPRDVLLVRDSSKATKTGTGP